MVDFLLCRRMMLLGDNSPFPFQIGVPDVWYLAEDGVNDSLIETIRQQYIAERAAAGQDVKDKFTIVLANAVNGTWRIYYFWAIDNLEIDSTNFPEKLIYSFTGRTEFYYNMNNHRELSHSRYDGTVEADLPLSNMNFKGVGWILDSAYSQLSSITDEVIWQGCGVPFSIGVPTMSPASQDFDLSLISTIRQRYVEFMVNRGVDVSSNYTIFIKDVITEGAGGPVSYYEIYGCYGFEIASSGYPLSLTYYNGDNYVQFTYNPTSHTLSNGNYYGVSDNWSYSISDNIANNGKGWILDSASYKIHSRTDRLCWTKVGIPLTVGIPNFPDYSMFTQEDIATIKRDFITLMQNNHQIDASSNYAIIVSHPQNTETYGFICFCLPEMTFVGDSVTYYNMEQTSFMFWSYNSREGSWIYGGDYGGSITTWLLPTPFSYSSLLTTGNGYMLDMAYNELYTRNGDLFWKKESNGNN